MSIACAFVAEPLNQQGQVQHVLVLAPAANGDQRQPLALHVPERLPPVLPVAGTHSSPASARGIRGQLSKAHGNRYPHPVDVACLGIDLPKRRRAFGLHLRNRVQRAVHPPPFALDPPFQSQQLVEPVG
jgi:hypothetical protein